MTIQRPPCPKCQTTTMLARITPGPAGFDIRTFECPACDFIHQIAVELVDPMKSADTLAWFQGELRAPA
ncbi:response regulator [Bradyrhizobium sp. 186]|uniref:response regulator n=1 Tax=Bradyrhizobium sp. 186 TaxID=2782654 RepID=UPI0020011000|nr:response regulator [Bradyrhizobium sp. 186]UPK34890.1 response regulator [Bradyrhizobium sp. 186]